MRSPYQRQPPNPRLALNQKRHPLTRTPRSGPRGATPRGVRTSEAGQRPRPVRIAVRHHTAQHPRTPDSLRAARGPRRIRIEPQLQQIPRRTPSP
ncbi:hypothetical protein, partial [Streptomyces coryli]|uniref:hypothetical protein n=1 Tax=Streptomyces coryli TaxID=1128680 RepID=UPI0019CF54D7